EGPHRDGGDQRKQNVAEVEGGFMHVAENGQRSGEDPRIQRRMREAAHVDQVALEKIFRLRGMQRIDLGVFGAVEVIGIVALNGLIQKRNSEQKHQENNNQPRMNTYEHECFICVHSCSFVAKKIYHWTGTPG